MEFKNLDFPKEVKLVGERRRRRRRRRVHNVKLQVEELRVLGGLKWRKKRWGQRGNGRGIFERMFLFMGRID